MELRLRTIGCAACLAAVFLLSAYAAPAAAQQDAAERRVLTGAERSALLERLNELQTGLQTFQAAFEESRHLATLNAPLRFSGRLYYDRAGLFCMVYTRPFEHTLRVQDNKALLYVTGSRTADEVDLSRVEGLAGRPDFFGWDPSGFNGTVVRDSTGYCLEESAPSTDGTPGLNLRILLDAETLLATHIRIQEGATVTDIALSQKQLNRALPEPVVHFTLPEGVTVNRIGMP